MVRASFVMVGVLLSIATYVLPTYTVPNTIKAFLYIIFTFIFITGLILPHRDAHHEHLKRHSMNFQESRKKREAAKK